MRSSLVSALTAFCSIQTLHVAGAPVKRQAAMTYTDNAGVFPEWTSIAGSLFGEATSKAVSAIAGIDTSERYQGPAATQTTWAPEPSPTEEPATWSSDSQNWAESQWSGATDAVGGAWSSYTSAYDSAASSAESVPTNMTSTPVATATGATVPTSSTTGAAFRQQPFWFSSSLLVIPLAYLLV